MIGLVCVSWVFRGNREVCGSRFGECWLKKQKDTLNPDWRDAGEKVICRSGLIFGEGQGIVKLKTEHVVIYVKVAHLDPNPCLLSPQIEMQWLLPNCAPHSVACIPELLALKHCAGCQFYRAERRGNSWDSQGNHIKHAPFGAPFALTQGIIEADGTTFKDIPVEVCPTIKRGSIAWVESGPEALHQSSKPR